jgi:hypothetical protein
MNTRPNNILSYFIKNIKDAKERAFYRQINEPGFIQIVYKDEILYEIICDCFYNYINNIIKVKSFKFIVNYNIWSNYNNFYKYLYYKQDRKIGITNRNYINYHFTYNKYLKKIKFQYIIDNKYILNISIIYFKKYKYIIKNSNGNRFSHKLTSAMILIPNKYELQYYCNFFNIYFVN